MQSKVYSTNKCMQGNSLLITLLRDLYHCDKPRCGTYEKKEEPWRNQNFFGLFSLKLLKKQHSRFATLLLAKLPIKPNEEREGEVIFPLVLHVK